MSTAAIQLSSASNATPSAPVWSGSAPVIQRAVFQESFAIPFNEATNAMVGAAMTQVQKKYKNTVKVEASTTRSTNITTFVVKGPDEAAVKAARKELTVALAKRVTLEVMIPQSLRAFVIGAKGKKFKAITDQTGCRVNLPRQNETASLDAVPISSSRDEVDYDNDAQIAVVVEGDEVNAHQAVKMIQAIVAERTSRTTHRLSTIEHIFYPFIAGPKGANASKLEADVGGGDVSIRVPPRAAFLPPKDGGADDEEPRRERDLSIIVNGDRERVLTVVQAIEAQVDEMRRTFRSLSISVPKRQHRLLVGDAANDILAKTQCSVELAAQDDPSDGVTIRGPQAQLPVALTSVMEKANAVKVDLVDLVAAHRAAPNALDHAKNLLRWLQFCGKLPRKDGVQVHLPRPAIIESTGAVHIEIVGSDQIAVGEVRATLDDLVKGTPPSFIDTVDVDPLLHSLLVGKKGANLREYEKKGADLVFPPASGSDGEGRSDVLIVVSPCAELSDKKTKDAEAKCLLQEVKAELLKASQQAADLKTEVLNVSAKFHRTVIGAGGSTLNAVLGEERLVAVRLGNAKGQSGADDSITIRGPSNEVDRVAAALKQIAKDAEDDAIVNGHEATLSVDPIHVKHLVGKSGASLAKLREELGVRVDFDDAASCIPNGTAGKKGIKVTCKITGRKENVEEAHRRLFAQAEKLADEREEVLKIAPNLHSAIIGKGGVWVSRLQDKHGVRIEFPRQGEAPEARRVQKPNEVIVRGGKKGVAAAKAEIMELLEYENEKNNVIEVAVGTRSLARILGKSGTTVNQIRDDTGAQIDIDGTGGQGTTTIRLRGTKKAIAEAKRVITAIDSEVKGEDTFTVNIPSKYHGQLIGPGGQGIRDLVFKAIGSAADSRAAMQLVQFPRRGEQNADVVIVRGPTALAKKVKEQLEAAAKVYTDRVCRGIIVAPEHQRFLIGRGGSKRSELESTFDVRLIFPGRTEHSQKEVENAAELGNAPTEHIVKILGKNDAVEAIKKEIASFAATTRKVKVPHALHSRLSQPSFFRQLRLTYGVNIETPRIAAAAGVPPAPTSNGASARIDDNEIAASAGELPFELVKLEEGIALGEEVEWTLIAKGDAEKAAAALQKAQDHIMKAISSAAALSHEGHLIVPEAAVPRVIGKQGLGLQSIEADVPGVSVEIPRDATRRGLCIIRGSEDAVLEARDRISRIATLQPRY